MCGFGKWLYSLDDQTRQSARWATVRSRHAEFHKAAAGVLAHAIAGRKAEAASELAPTGSYSRATAALTSEMTAWKQDVAS